MSAWVVGSCVVSPLGLTSTENYEHLRLQVSGLSVINDASLSPNSIVAGRMATVAMVDGMTRFESMCHRASENAVQHLALKADRTLYILSTTKGNISLLDDADAKTLPLHASARILAAKAGLSHYLVVSNACISGVLAIITAKRFLEAGLYDHVVVVGADELSRFVIAGFQSLHALSDLPCKPFDASRSGINLGEAAAAIVLSARPDQTGHYPSVAISGGGVSNDANHISGPSRTGNELAMAVRQALAEADRTTAAIDFISAHGTATLFNDEMEAKAFSQLKMNSVPLHSLKGYFGHTLGAAGIVETVMCIEGLLRNEVPATKGFESIGVSEPLRITSVLQKQPLSVCLKTASGFGGCNAAIVIEKEKKQ